MEKKFLTYSLEQLIEDKKFISWVLRGTQNHEWRNFLEKNDVFRSRAKKAREIILLLRDKYDVLDEDSILELWKNISRYDHLHKQKYWRLKIRRALNRYSSRSFMGVFSVHLVT